MHDKEASLAAYVLLSRNFSIWVQKSNWAFCFSRGKNARSRRLHRLISLVILSRNVRFAG